jgi:Predicted metal-dependent hydrolase
MSIVVQTATECAELPDHSSLTQWVALATQQNKDAEVLLRLVDEAESTELNQTYRQEKRADQCIEFSF